MQSGCLAGDNLGSGCWAGPPPRHGTKAMGGGVGRVSEHVPKRLYKWRPTWQVCRQGNVSRQKDQKVNVFGSLLDSPFPPTQSRPVSRRGSRGSVMQPAAWTAGPRERAAGRCAALPSAAASNRFFPTEDPVTSVGPTA